MFIKSIKKVEDLAGKRVLVRIDFNVPIKDGNIIDDYKITRGLETIKYLVENNCKVILLTHLGSEMLGKFDAEFSVKPIADRLSKLINKKIGYVKDCIGLEAGTAVAKVKNGEILMLENIRFVSGEGKNDLKLAKNLAKLADIYVNEAFAESHRNYASMSAIKKYLPSYAGLLLEQEIINLEKAVKPNKPLIVILGGAKIATKIPLIKKLYKKSFRILIGGGLANNFFVAHNLEIGHSLFDSESVKFAKKFKYKNIILPVDVIVLEKGSENPVPKHVSKINKTDTIYDIGPKTISLFAGFIKKANTIFWNGPLGMFEDNRFKHGTIETARVVGFRSKGKAFGVAGGGETVEAIKLSKMMEDFDWVSTGGGAMLSYLGGEKMPGLIGLVK
jgi:3-phosphoglycerate kinase